jgi:hypothetical protein
MDALEMMYLEDLANAEWRLKRATRWEQAIGRKNDPTSIAADALRSGTEKLGIPESSRGWRCRELGLSLTTEKNSKPEDAYIPGDPVVELSAKLADPVDDFGHHPSIPTGYSEGSGQRYRPPAQIAKASR